MDGSIYCGRFIYLFLCNRHASSRMGTENGKLLRGEPDGQRLDGYYVYVNVCVHVQIIALIRPTVWLSSAFNTFRTLDMGWLWLKRIFTLHVINLFVSMYVHTYVYLKALNLLFWLCSWIHWKYLLLIHTYTHSRCNVKILVFKNAISEKVSQIK